MRNVHGRHRPPPLRLAIAAALFAAGGTPLSPTGAEGQTARLQAARLDNVATVVTVQLEVRGSGGGTAGLPAPGETVERDVRWLIATGMLGVGASFASGGHDANGLTATGHLGLLTRTPLFIDRVGVLATGFARPLAAGPALRLETGRLAGLQVGGLWYEDRLGFRWLASLDLSLTLLTDAFAR